VSAVDQPVTKPAGGEAKTPRRRSSRRRLLNRRPSRAVSVSLALLPFALILGAYVVASSARLAENPFDPVTPSLTAMAETFWRMATEPDVRTGDLLLWTDTASSLIRLGAGVVISAAIALVMGIGIGLLPFFRSTFAPVVAAISLIPPITVLPILYITLGVGETAKIALIIFGIAPVMVRGVARAVSEIPEEQIVKAETLGASTWQIIMRVVLPQALPHLVNVTRLGLGPAWIFLVTAEAIVAESGLGYRIFLVRRYSAMDIILPYVAWITLIAYLIDLALRQFATRAFRWAYPSGRTL